ncbi:hypothetical protein NMG60_11001737 [Bertholletia excelsa]
MDLALRDMGLDSQMIAAIHDMLEFSEDTETAAAQPPSRAFVRDAKAMRATTADILEFPNSYVFIVDMPGVTAEQVKAHVGDGNILVVTGERRREKEREHEEGVKYVKMERRQGKFLKRFELPDNANTDAISAHYEDGVLTVTVEKRPPPEPKKPRTIEIKVGSARQEQGRGSTEEPGKGQGHASAGAQGEGDGTTNA